MSSMCSLQTHLTVKRCIYFSSGPFAFKFHVDNKMLMYLDELAVIILVQNEIENAIDEANEQIGYEADWMHMRRWLVPLLILMCYCFC